MMYLSEKGFEWFEWICKISREATFWKCPTDRNQTNRYKSNKYQISREATPQKSVHWTEKKCNKIDLNDLNGFVRFLAKRLPKECPSNRNEVQKRGFSLKIVWFFDNLEEAGFQ